MLFLFVSTKHTYRNEAKIELFSLTERIWCQGSYRHSCLKLGKTTQDITMIFTLPRSEMFICQIEVRIYNNLLLL